MTTPDPPVRRRRSLPGTLLRVVIVLVGLILAARLVPMAIQALAAGGRGAAGALAGISRPLLWIAGALLVPLLLLLVVRRRSARQRRRRQHRSPPN